jgi:hypothetical protein
MVDGGSLEQRTQIGVRGYSMAHCSASCDLRILIRLVPIGAVVVRIVVCEVVVRLDWVCCVVVLVRSG